MIEPSKIEPSHHRKSAGDRVPPFEVETLSHGRLRLPRGGLTHLSFRRFTGCPICNLHLRGLAREQEALGRAGVSTVAFFHSPREQMIPYQGDLPFPVVPDAGRQHYRAFGVEQSLAAPLHPRAMASAIKGLFTVPANPFAGGSEQGGLPADFLLSGEGKIEAVHYGSHADDQWDVDEILRLAAGR